MVIMRLKTSVTDEHLKPQTRLLTVCFWLALKLWRSVSSFILTNFPSDQI